MIWLLILKFFVILGWQNVTSKQIKQEVFQFTKDFQVPNFQVCINNTSFEHFTKNTLWHWINLKQTCETQVVGNITIYGDASHPTTPNFGQGGCIALKDGIILRRNLHHTLKSKKSQVSKVHEREQIHQALLDFHKQKYPRTNALTQKAIMVGVLVVANTSIKCFLQDWFFMPMSIHTGNYMELSLFDVEKLPIDEPWHNFLEGKLWNINCARTFKCVDHI